MPDDGPRIEPTQPTRWAGIHLSPYLLFVVAAMCWGGNTVASRAAAVLEVGPLHLSFGRLFVALMVVLPLGLHRCWAQRGLIREAWLPLLGISVFAVAGFNMLIYTAVNTTTAINAGLIVGANPILIALMSWLALREPITARQAIGLLAGLLGVMVIVSRGQFDSVLEMRFVPGDLLMLLAITFFGIYSVLLRFLPRDLHPMTLLVATNIIAVILAVPFLLWERAAGLGMNFTWDVILIVLFVGIVPGVVSFVCWNQGVIAVGPSRASPFMYLVPVFATVLAILLLGERMQVFHFMGIAAIFAGVYLATRRHPAPR